MQALRESWLTVKDSPFHTLTKQEIIDESSMPKLDARISPLAKWLKKIGEAYQSLEPQTCSVLQERVSLIAEKTEDHLLAHLEGEAGVFRFGVFFGAYGVVFLKEESYLEAATQLCEKIKELELQVEAKAEDWAIGRTIGKIATSYEQFIVKITPNNS